MLLDSIDNIDASGVLALLSMSICFIGIESSKRSSKLSLGTFCIRDRKSVAAFSRPGICESTLLKPSICPKSSKMMEEVILTEKTVRLLIPVKTMTTPKEMR